MKVLLIKDVYNLGRAGEVKKVADGYARNFLLPQKMAVFATEGALKQVERIQAAAAKQRELLNEEMSGLAEQIQGLELSFTAKVGETGRLFGSITQQNIIDAINSHFNAEVASRYLDQDILRLEGSEVGTGGSIKVKAFAPVTTSTPEEQESADVAAQLFGFTARDRDVEVSGIGERMASHEYVTEIITEDEWVSELIGDTYEAESLEPDWEASIEEEETEGHLAVVANDYNLPLLP